MIKLEIQLHDNNNMEVEVESYSATTLGEQINNRDLTVVVIGDKIISRTAIKLIKEVTTQTIN